MAFSATPIGFFGPGYALTASELKLPTVDFADITIATFTTAFATDNSLIFAAYHNLKVGDKISLTTTATLPAPLAPATDYYVKTASGPGVGPHVITLSATKGGAEITLTTDGTGTHTAHALAPLQLVTDVEAHATTGDWRKVVQGLAEMLFQKYNNTATGDRPTGITITKTERSLNAATGVMISAYTISVRTQPVVGELIEEA